MLETFTKEERLCLKKLISRLFKEGSSSVVPPFRYRWLFVLLENPYPAQLLISVPRTSFSRAVDRNLLKRRIREAYRKQKTVLYDSLNASRRQMIVAITYTGHEILPFPEIQEKIIVILQRLTKEVEKAAE
ncbi:MAG: ribonuclease P protein component [bacterium]